MEGKILTYFERRQLYNQTRFRDGLVMAGIAAVFALIFSIIFLSGKADIPINIITETRTSNLDAQQAPVTDATPQNAPCPVNTQCTVATVYTFLGRSLYDTIRLTFLPPTDMTIAWFIRFLACSIMLVVVLVFFRARICDRHLIDLDPIRTDLFKQIHFTIRWMAIPIIASFFLLTYILSSAGARLLEIMFTGLELGAIEITVLSIVFAALLAFLAVHFISAANTHDLLITGLAIIFMGFAWGFSVAETGDFVDGCGTSWYCYSISNTGIQSSSGLIFTLTMMGMGTFLWLVWRDLRLIVSSIIKNRAMLPNQNTSAETAGQLQWLDRINIAMTIAFLMIIGIGLIPTIDEANFIFIPLDKIHLLMAFGGPLLFVLAGKFGITWLMRKFLPSHFWNATILLLALDAVALLLFAVNQSTLYTGVMSLNTTAFELWILTSVCLWYYGFVYYTLDIIDGIESDEVLKAIRVEQAGHGTETPQPATSVRQFDTGTVPVKGNLYVQLQEKILPSPLAKKD